VFSACATSFVCKQKPAYEVFRWREFRHVLLRSSLRAATPEERAAAIAEAAEALCQGRLAVMPTETVYGLAANASMPEALERLARSEERRVGSEGPHRRGAPYMELRGDVSGAVPS